MTPEEIAKKWFPKSKVPGAKDRMEFTPAQAVDRCVSAINEATEQLHKERDEEHVRDMRETHQAAGGEIQRLKDACAKEFADVQTLSDENQKIRAEKAALAQELESVRFIGNETLREKRAFETALAKTRDAADEFLAAYTAIEATQDDCDKAGSALSTVLSLTPANCADRIVKTVNEKYDAKFNEGKETL